MKTTVLALGLYPSSGGPSKSVRSFADALNANVISWVDPLQAERDRLIWEHSLVVHGSRLPIRRQLLIPNKRDLPAAERLVAESDLVSVHSFWRWHNIWIWDTARKHGVPYWFVPHGILDPYVFTTDRVAKRLFLALGGTRFLTDAAAVVCATRREYHKLAHFVPDKPHAIIPWPLHSGDFRNRLASRRSAIRSQLGIPDDAFCLLFLGRLDPMKRPLETIDALAACRNKTIHLVIVGSEFGVTVAECRAKANAAGIANRVHVIGPAYGEEKHGLLDAADAYISLSHRENFNFAAAECLASGMPVILSPGNDLSDDLRPVGCGWMIPEGASATASIEEAADATEMTRRDLGSNGRAWAEARLRFAGFRDSITQFAAAIAR